MKKVLLCVFFFLSYFFLFYVCLQNSSEIYSITVELFYGKLSAVCVISWKNSGIYANKKLFKYKMQHNIRYNTLLFLDILTLTHRSNWTGRRKDEKKTHQPTNESLLFNVCDNRLILFIQSNSSRLTFKYAAKFKNSNSTCSQNLQLMISWAVDFFFFLPLLAFFSVSVLFMLMLFVDNYWSFCFKNLEFSVYCRTRMAKW